MDERVNEVALQCHKVFVKRLMTQPWWSRGYRQRGRILRLPFKRWFQVDTSQEKRVLAIAQGKAASQREMFEIGSKYMPAELRKRFLGPSLPNINLPLPFERRQIWYPEYKRVEYREKNRSMIQQGVVGAIAIDLQNFLFKWIGNPCDLVATFNHPEAQTKLPVYCQLAAGVVRDVFIVPRFGSMHHFWLKHAEMMKTGLHWRIYPTHLGEHDFLEYLKDDPEVMAMYELAQEIGVWDY